MKRFIFIAILAFLLAGIGAVATDTDIGAKDQQELIIESDQAGDGITLDHATGHVEYASVFRVQPKPDLIWPTSVTSNKYLLLNNYFAPSGKLTLNPNNRIIGEPINFT